MSNYDKFVEFDTILTLEDLSSQCLSVPCELIMNKNMNVNRISVFSYIYQRAGINNIVGLRVPDLTGWCGYSDVVSTNKKIAGCISELISFGYFCDSPKFKPCGYSEIVYNRKYIKNKVNNEEFALLWLDEIEKIMSYDLSDRGIYKNNSTILLVFAYLRWKIHRRNNTLVVASGYENKTREKMIEARRIEYPEAYNETYKNIGEQIGVSERAVSDAVRILAELGLIVYRTAYRTKYQREDGSYGFSTNSTIFANAYKREYDKLIAAGEDYYMREILNKVKKIKNFNSKFRLKCFDCDAEQEDKENEQEGEWYDRF